jgi:hypothetical protein
MDESRNAQTTRNSIAGNRANARVLSTARQFAISRSVLLSRSARAGLVEQGQSDQESNR